MTTVKDLIDRLKQANVQECPFVRGILGIKCEDILALEASEKAGKINSDLADQYSERCLASGWPRCSLFGKYARKIAEESGKVKIENINPLCLCYLNSQTTGT